MSFTRPFLLGPVFFRTPLPCFAGYHLKRGGMPLHETVGVNCEKGATTENLGAVYGLRGECSMIVFVFSVLTVLSLLGGGRKSWYIIYYFKIYHEYCCGSGRQFLFYLTFQFSRFLSCNDFHFLQLFLL